MVRPESEAVTPRRSERRGSFPPPLMVTPAAGPVIVCVPPVSSSSSWPPLSVIVWGVLNTVESKTIVFAWLSALAWLMQYRRSPASLEPLPASPRLLTVNVASKARPSRTSRTGRGGGDGEPRGRQMRTALEFCDGWPWMFPLSSVCKGRSPCLGRSAAASAGHAPEHNARKP